MGFGAIILSFLITVSSLMMYIASKYNIFWLMMLARGIFGVGAESLIVAQASIAEKWFTGKFLTVALGLNNICSLLGAGLAA
jgi:MFS family permease